MAVRKNFRLLKYELILYHFKASDVVFKMMYNMFMLPHRFSNKRCVCVCVWGGGGGGGLS